MPDFTKCVGVSRSFPTTHVHYALLVTLIKQYELNEMISNIKLMKVVTVIMMKSSQFVKFTDNVTLHNLYAF